MRRYHVVLAPTMLLVLSLYLGACSGGSGSGGAGGGDGSGGTSGSGSAGAAGGRCAQAVSVQQDTEKEDDCTTIAVFIGLQDDERLKSITKLFGEAATTGLDNTLKRASVVSNSDVAAAVAYSTQLQLLGGEDVNEVAMRVAESYSNAEILVVFSVAGDPDGVMAARLSAYDKKNNRSLGAVGISGNAGRLAEGAQTMGVNLAEKIKDARVCLSLTPVRTVIDFEDENKRTQDFTLTVKNLKNENTNEGEASFELAQPEWGKLSRASGRVSGGKLETVFTMTKKNPNSLTAIYKNEYTTNEDVSTIIPLCGWLLVIEGEKVFNLDHASPPLVHALLGDGSWITVQGKNTVGGHVALTIADDDTTVFGTGWLSEMHGTSGEVFAYVRNQEGEIIGDCKSKSTIDGLATGNWVVWGTAAGDEISIQGFALGSAPGAEKGSGRCTMAGLSAGGGGSNDAGVLSEFHDVKMPLEAGATAEASGTGPFFLEKYDYTLTLKRAAP